MKRKIFIALFSAVILCSCGQDAPSPDSRPPGKVVTDPENKETYSVFLGNTHAHCLYSGDAVQTDANTVERHFSLARENGYDFYCVTDHSQYDSYTEEAWEHILSASEKYTDDDFVAIRGYEHSENDGPGAKGHQNVYNSSTFLNALDDGIDMEYFHDWISSAGNSGVIVSMNHPEKDQYDDFACYNETARDRITMFEVINGDDLYYESYLTALDKGWKVSPIAGCDNHATNAVSRWQSRTGVAAKKLSEEDIFDAMRNRRTYATSDKNLEMVYYVNNHVMGSVFSTSSGTLYFEVTASDPDTGDPDQMISRIEISDISGKTVASEDFESHKVEWAVGIPARKGCFFVKIYNFTDSMPAVYAAPVWIE